MTIHQSDDTLVTMCNAEVVPNDGVSAFPARCYKPTLSLTHSSPSCCPSKYFLCLESSHGWLSPIVHVLSQILHSL